MPYTKKITSYEVNPVEVNDRLVGLEIRRLDRTDRRSDDHRTLERGSTSIVEEMEIPISKVADLIRELADWPIYFATQKEG